MPGSWIGYPYYGTSEFYEDIARVAERGVMDMLFFGDTGGTSEDYGGNHDAVVRYGAKWPRHDMTPMIPLMAKAAQGVGFALTLSTTYHHPFHCARLFNALDHVTRGRVAWNAVTSASTCSGVQKMWPSSWVNARTRMMPCNAPDGSLRWQPPNSP